MKRNSILNSNDVKNAEQLLKKEIDIKYYHAIKDLLEKGYLLDDISAAFLKELCEKGVLKEKSPVKKKTGNNFSKQSTVANKGKMPAKAFKKEEKANQNKANKKRYYKGNKKQNNKG